MRLRLVLKGPDRLMGAQTVRTLAEGSIVVGRAPTADWVLPDPNRVVSKAHCRIDKDISGFVLTDTSTNGIHINDEPVRFGLPRQIAERCDQRPQRAAARGEDVEIERRLGDAAKLRPPSRERGRAQDTAYPARTESKGSRAGRPTAAAARHVPLLRRVTDPRWGGDVRHMKGGGSGTIQPSRQPRSAKT